MIVLLLVAGGTLVVRGALPCGAWQLQPACYVALHPGPMEDTFGLVAIDDAQAYPATGELLLTTVAVESELDLGEWVFGTFTAGVDQVPREQIFPPGSDRDQIREQNVALMVDSQLDATIAALRELGFDFDTDFDGAEVVEVTEASAAAGKLESGDVVVGVDGEPVRDNRQLVEAIQGREPGEVVTLTVRPAGVSEEQTVEIELGAAPEDPDQAQLGVTVTSYLQLPVDVDIDAGIIGGPSAGLVFSLSLIELLQPEDLLGGAVIAATGTIDRAGNVGAIGGIRQKVRAASGREEGPPASVFLVPRGNFAEAGSAAVTGDILLVPVSTLGDALAALSALRSGDQPVDAQALSAP